MRLLWRRRAGEPLMPSSFIKRRHALLAPADRKCPSCYQSFSGPWCDNCDAWPCTCRGTWRINCGAGLIPEGQGEYGTVGAAEDVMRLHGGACPGAHAVEFVPEAVKLGD